MADGAGNSEPADARAAVLDAVVRFGEHGGLSLRPAELHTELPLRPPSTAVAGTVANTVDSTMDGARPAVGTDPGPLARIVAPTVLLGLLGLLVVAGAVTVAALTAGTLLAVLIAVVGVAGLGAGAGAVSRRATRHSALLAAADHPESSGGSRSWQSRQPWLGPLGQSRERRLVFVALDIVTRIATSDAWGSAYLDEHRVRLDLLTELDEIDEQAHRLAALRHQAGEPDPGRPDSGQPANELTQSWDALVDRVAALSVYADRLQALEADLAQLAATERAELPGGPAAQLIAGSVRDELASDQLRTLAEDLRHRSDGQSGDVTNYGTSHRNGT
ncbi:MAG TPA: hypothetical protein VHW44_01065 [Pseudonocardiaceae bacterium]|nr:hypothetical protein [Pseudonocardiaceae bacterium]